jgi:S-(hydroxymethyl)glutathione dehydrogenase/alcohol dehydrogenase
MRAAVHHAPQQEQVFQEVEIAEPIGYEVLVRTVAAGVCHSDLKHIDGRWSLPIEGPAVLGHESAGVVEAVGPNVTEFAPGDHVIGCLSVFCGHCDRCLTGETYLCMNQPVRSPEEPPRLSLDGQAVAQYANVGGYAEQMLLHETGVVRIDTDIPFDVAALIGCAVTTGMGAALNTARVRPGSTVAVYGAGGVGLSVIQGARIAGARMIIAVDVEEHKLRTARDLGATHGVDASAGDPVEQIRDLTDGLGVDYAFEAIGMKRTLEQTCDSIRNGGLAISIGGMPLGERLEIAPEWLFQRTLMGSALGSNHFKVDTPKYIEFYRQGRLKLDQMVTKRGRLEDLNDALDSIRQREVARTVLMFD